MKDIRNPAMTRWSRFCLFFLLSLTITLTACSIGATVTGIEQSGDSGAVGPQMIEGATEVVKFDPATIPLGDREPVVGACEVSSLVPGTYRCQLGTDGAAEPCFALGGGSLLCGPDPAARTYDTLVSATGSLPSVFPPSPDRAVHFFVELDNGMTCALRSGPEPVIVGGITAVYDCNEPYTYILDGGELTLDKSAPAWIAAVYTLDVATGESSGKTPANVVRAWIP